MGFIDYNGTKEDRYSEVVEYAHIQQEEDWKRKQDAKIQRWLEELMGSARGADYNIEELLKNVAVQYGKITSIKDNLFPAEDEKNKISTRQIWEDFTLEFTYRHLEAFHLDQETKEKQFDSLLTKVFKIFDKDIARNFYKTIASNYDYKKYMAECFDPTWGGRHFYKYLHAIKGSDKSKQEEYLKFLETCPKLGIFMSLYLYRAYLPRDDGWMIQTALEWDSFRDIVSRARKNSMRPPNLKEMRNPIGFQDHTEHIEDTTLNDFESKASGLNHTDFLELYSSKNLPKIAKACQLILEYGLPEDIEENYKQLNERILVLREAVEKFDDVYHADLDQFTEYFAPETLKLTGTYIEYRMASPSDEIMGEIRENVLVASRKLLQIVNEKIDEIYKFVAIETKAEAMALEAIMSQGGYVDSNFKIY